MGHTSGLLLWPLPERGCEFQSFTNSSQSCWISLINKNRRTQMCSGSIRLSLWSRSSRVNKPRHKRAKWRPASTQSRSIRVLDVDLTDALSEEDKIITAINLNLRAPYK